MSYQLYSHCVAEPMVEVFKTNVDKRQDAEGLVQRLRELFPDYRINFDMDDCDHILRVQSNDDSLYTERIMDTVRGAGFSCSILEE